MELYDLLSLKEIKLGEIIELDKNNIIFYEDEICEYVYFLLEGEVVISSSDIEGNEELYNHLYKGDIFGNVLIFADKNKYLGNGIAVKKSKIFKLKKNDLLNIMSTNKQFLLEYLKYNSNETMASKIKSKMLSKRNIKERIIYYLNINKGCKEISITKLSREIMINRVCVSRVVSSLIKDNILEKKGKRLILI